MSSEPENILEILLRLVRGERATPFSGSSSSASITGSSISGPLLAALSGSSSSSASGGGFAYGEKQTHVSLAVLALWRMTLEYARKAAAAKDGESSAEEAAAVKEVEERVGEIIRCLPGHLVYKSLDGMFKEWKVEKKGGRG
jgi:20S proteasome subunit alpha 6